MAAEKAIGESIEQITAVSGGDFAKSYCATLGTGERLFIKTHRQPPEGFFTTEATGLQWLAESNSVAIPRVRAVCDSPPFLALEWIEQGVSSAHTEEDFGRLLARLHQCSFPRFGRQDNRLTGSLGLSNNSCDSWAEFYSTRRLLPLARLARDKNALPGATLSDIEALAYRLNNYDVQNEHAALLHGDLWAGNRIIDTNGVSWLIDPACYGGHREFDLAMMRLFGGFDSDCFDAYNEVYPLADGWEERISLHQLAPLIVHAIKFGGGYVSEVQSALRLYS